MKLGVIAGNRLSPLIFSKSAKAKDKSLELIGICFYGETNRGISRYVDKTFWLQAGQLKRLVEIIRKEDLNKLVMVGQISPKRIFDRKYWDDKMLRLAEDIEDFRPHTLFSRLIRTLEILGVEFLDSTMYMKDYLAAEGIMNDLEITSEIQDDIDFGTEIASKFVELDIGQCIVVKKKTPVALEGLEGTDRTIIRAYRLAGAGCIVLKFSKKDQDLRFDVPIVGLNTLKLLRRIKASVLVLEKDRVIILEKEKFLRLSHIWGIPIIGKSKIG